MHQLLKLLQVDSVEQFFILAPVGFVFLHECGFVFLHKWRRTPSCASFNAWSAALLTSTCDIFHPNLCSFNQRFHDVKLLATLCANIAMRHEVIAVGHGSGDWRADLSTPTLHPRTSTNGRPRDVLFTFQSCPPQKRWENRLLHCGFEGKIFKKIYEIEIKFRVEGKIFQKFRQI